MKLLINAWSTYSGHESRLAYFQIKQEFHAQIFIIDKASYRLKSGWCEQFNLSSFNSAQGDVFSKKFHLSYLFSGFL